MTLSYVIIAELEIKEKESKKKVRFASFAKFKNPREVSMMCTFNERFFSSMKNTLIGDSGTSCHITNDDTGLLASLTLANWYRVVQTICLIQKRLAVYEGISSQ